MIDLQMKTEKAITFSEGEILNRFAEPKQFINLKLVMWCLPSMKLLLSTCFHV